MAHETVDAFRSLEAKDQHLKTKRMRSDEEREAGPHVVLLPKGAVPEYIKLTPYQEFCWRTMGNYVKRRGMRDELMEENLVKAHMKIRPEEYFAFIYMTAVIALVGGIVAGIVLFVILMGVSLIMALLLGIVLPVMIPVMVIQGHVLF